MKLTIYRGTHEIGGTLIECRTTETRLLIDAGYPLFLNGLPIEDGIASMPPEKLMDIGVLPLIHGLYSWDKPSFDAIIISHAHFDHYGLTKYAHSAIPVYVSAGTEKLIKISQTFKIYDSYPINANLFKMYEPFSIGDILVKPYLMDHSAFDAAAFELKCNGKTVIYSGDFRGHGRKAVCLDIIIRSATQNADLLLIEGTMLGRLDERTMTEDLLKEEIIREARGKNGPILFQSSSQNIDRIVSFYKATRELGKIFVIDIYTANVLYELGQLGNKVPFPCNKYPNIRVFYPYRITQKIFNEIDEVYAKRFAAYRFSREMLRNEQRNIIMMVRPSMTNDLKRCGFNNGLFIYSLWQGYRNSDYQKRFEDFLRAQNFSVCSIHTSGHATTNDIQRLIKGLKPKKIVPIHTMVPDLFNELSDKVEVKADGEQFEA